MSDIDVNKIEEKFKYFETRIQSLLLENLYLREVFNNKIEQCMESVNKANQEIAEKMDNLQKTVENNSNKPVLIGYYNADGFIMEPIFGHKKYNFIELIKSCKTRHRCNYCPDHTHIYECSSHCEIKLESLLMMNIKLLDLFKLKNANISYNDINIYTILPNIISGNLDNSNDKGIKIIHDFCNKHDIELLWNGNKIIITRMDELN